MRKSRPPPSLSRADGEHVAAQVPGLDGSAQPWMERIAVCGLRPAPPSAERQADADPGEGDPAARIARKMCWLPLRPITVYSPDITRGGAWAALYPCGVEHRLTAGVERDVPAIGQQWLTIDGASTSVPEDGLIFAMDIAPARTWLESLDEAYALQEEGFLMAGTSGSVLVADGRDWLSSASSACLLSLPRLSSSGSCLATSAVSRCPSVDRVAAVRS